MRLFLVPLSLLLLLFLLLLLLLPLLLFLLLFLVLVLCFTAVTVVVVGIASSAVCVVLLFKELLFSPELSESLSFPFVNSFVVQHFHSRAYFPFCLILELRKVGAVSK